MHGDDDDGYGDPEDWIVMEIPDGSVIDNDGPIDFVQGR